MFCPGLSLKAVFLTELSGCAVSFTVLEMFEGVYPSRVLLKTLTRTVTSQGTAFAGTKFFKNFIFVHVSNDSMAFRSEMSGQSGITTLSG